MTAPATSAAQLQFRQAQPEDLDALIRLLADDPLGQQRETHGGGVDEGYRRAFQAIDADPAHQLWLARLPGDDTIIGLLQLSYIPGLTYQGGLRAQVEGVRVHREFRGRGIGAALMQHAIDEARQRGCVLLQLTSDLRRPEALAFYQALGFTASHSGFKMWFDAPASGNDPN